MERWNSSMLRRMAIALVFVSLAIDSGLAEGASPSATAATTEITNYINSTFYADADVIKSFHTRVGQQIDCIDFYAQHSVKALLVAGIPVTAAAPALPAQISNSMPPINSIPPLIDGSVDADGITRNCPATAVPAIRPTLQQIQSAGGLQAYLDAVAAVPPLQAPNEQAQLDCFDYTTSGSTYDHAAGYQYVNQAHGVATITTIFNPQIEQGRGSLEHSITQIWALTGNCEWDAGRTRSGQNPCNASGQVPTQTLEMGVMTGSNPFNTSGSTQPTFVVFASFDAYANACWA
ncbi:MAG: hypothetical protein ACLP1X_28830, partial [Polyangiaceae bacterium]